MPITVEFLLGRGIQFNTFIHGPHSPTQDQTLLPAHVGLGYQPQGYEPGPRDYAHYCAVRDTFLRSPRGRVALMHGGLIAQLARDAVPYEDGILGPTDNVFETGVCLTLSSSEGYWDDALTETELDLICRVYQVSTGNYVRLGMPYIY